MPIGLSIGSNNSNNNNSRPAIRFVTGNMPLYSVQQTLTAGEVSFERLPEKESTFRIGSQTLADIIRSKTWMESPLGKPGMSGGAYLVKGDDGSKYVLKYMRGNPFYNQYADAEIKMLMELVDSPYIVKLLAATLYSEKCYILYPYVPGKTLTEWLAVHKAISERNAVYVHLMNGLIDIHSRGYVHRDVKPANIWIPDDSTQSPFFLDLGLTAPIDSEHLTPGGTPQYMKSSESRETAKMEQNYYALGKIIQEDPISRTSLSALAKVMMQDGFDADAMRNALTAYPANSAPNTPDYAPTIPPIASAFKVNSVGGGAENDNPLQKMNYAPVYTVTASPAPLSTHNTYATWPGGVDPSASLFNTDNQKGGKNRKMSRKNRKASRKNRKASRKNRKASRKNRKTNRR